MSSENYEIIEIQAVLKLKLITTKSHIAGGVQTRDLSSANTRSAGLELYCGAKLPSSDPVFHDRVKEILDLPLCRRRIHTVRAEGIHE